MLSSLPQNLQDKIMPEPMSGCWIWIGGRIGGRYGHYYPEPQKAVLAHRFMFETLRHKIPENKVIDHLCRNPSCVNPDHLDCVSMGENTLRGDLYKIRAEKRKNRTHCNRGHLFTEENTQRTGDGQRYCKICQYMKADQWRKDHPEKRKLYSERVKAKRIKKPKRTHCKRGHEKTVYLAMGKNGRYCTLCAKITCHNAYLKRKEKEKC